MSVALIYLFFFPFSKHLFGDFFRLPFVGYSVDALTALHWDVASIEPMSLEAYISRRFSFNLHFDMNKRVSGTLQSMDEVGLRSKQRIKKLRLCTQIMKV